MKKLGLTFAIILSGIIIGCDLDGEIDALISDIGNVAKSALGGGKYVGPIGDGSTSNNFPFKIDSATYLGANGLTLWTSYVFHEYSPDTARVFHVRYRDLTHAYSSDNDLTLDEIIPDTIIQGLGIKYLLFPLEIKDLQPQTEYLFCIDLRLFHPDYQYTITSPCETFQTSS